MKIKRLKQIKINSYTFTITWDKSTYGADFSYKDLTIRIGIKDSREGEILESVCHELWEICALEMGVRYARPDCDTDYLFSYDHRQHTTMTGMFSGLIAQFIG